jgi:putative transposase
MKNYRKTSHSVYDLKFHLVWITKYRKPVLFGNVATRLRDLVRETCKSMEVEILKGHVSKDHVHLLVSVPPYISVSDLVKRVKGKTSRKLLSENRNLMKQFWGRHLWARGYFAASSGNVTDEVIMEYIAMQDVAERAGDDDFTISP